MAPPWNWPPRPLAELSGKSLPSDGSEPFPAPLGGLVASPSPFPRPLLNGPEESLLSGKQLCN